MTRCQADANVRDLKFSCRGVAAFISTLLLVAISGEAAEPVSTAVSDQLAAEFRDPPGSARPRVWWHWMNGNITKDGITKDLQWMRRVGIAGVQNFDAALQTPQLVERRLVYMSPEWKDAFRYAVEQADGLGMEFAIASSPGWSETGGPWVPPEQAMKKLVWSEMTLNGGKRFRGKLSAPPLISGPYQGIASAESGIGAHATPGFYRDVAVVACRIAATTTLPQATAMTNGQIFDAKSLLDGDFKTGVPVPPSIGENPGTLEYAFAEPQVIRSAVVYIANLPSNSFAGTIVPRLEASDDGKVWRTVTDIHLTKIPSTVSFAPVTARNFRLLFVRSKPRSQGDHAVAPGVDIAAMGGVGMSSAQSATQPDKVQVVEFELAADARVNAFEQKAGFAIADNYYALDESVDGEIKGVAPDSIIDLTNRMAVDGTLDWRPPAGHWKVLRLGFSLTGKINYPATAEATGLEVDKYDGTAVANYLKAYLGMYRASVGADLIGRQGIQAIVTDSTEVGASNWTPQFLDQFQRLRGYDARPWLPALTGMLVGSRQQSDAFLYDFRRTLADLVATEHYGVIATVAHEQGLTIYGESLEGGRRTLGDDMEMRRFADVPMAALWAFRRKPQPDAVADMRGAASTAHLYGQRFVAAESLTSILAPWAFSPSELQPMIDAEFANGINRPVIHTSVHQPLDSKLPGLSLGVYGQYFTRHETWAEMAKPWIDYIARNSYLLQQGRNVADIAYFYGEEQPIGNQAKETGIPDVPTRYAYDFVSPDALLHQLAVEDGDIVAKGGARYKALYLGGQSQFMTLPVLRRLAELAAAGATIVGAAPQRSPSLADDGRQFAELAQVLWPGKNPTNIGKGRVIASKDIEAALAAINVAPDFSYSSAQASEVSFVHRRTSEGDIYFVDNSLDGVARIEAQFRVQDKISEIWHADTGISEPVSYRTEDNRTVVPLEMRPRESFFVVFRKPAISPAVTVARRTYNTVAEIAGPWVVTFQPDRGAPATMRLESLVSLSLQAEPGIKYFSGIATYSKTFKLPKGIKPGAPLLIDFARIGDVAEVRVNGNFAGTAWKAPYRLDIGALVRSGNNTLEVRVANLWVNRLIGDAQPEANKVTFTTLPTYMAGAPLRPSGLIGPVTLMKVGTGN